MNITDPYLCSQSGVIRLCPTCLAQGVVVALVQVSARAFVCPVARNEATVISQGRRESVKATAEQRVSGLPF